MSQKVLNSIRRVKPCFDPISPQRPVLIRSGMAATALVALLGTVSACGDTGSGGPVKAGPSGVPTETAAARTYSADRLKQALLTQQNNGLGFSTLAPPVAGEYGKMAAVAQYRRTQSSMTVEPAHCLDTAKGSMASPVLLKAASAMGTLTGKGTVFSETLLAVSPGTARTLVGYELPADCRVYRVKLGKLSTTNRVAVSASGRLGQGSHTVGVLTKVASHTTRTWAVTVTARGYVVVITLSGRTPTRADAERLAGKAYEQAAKTLT